MHEMLVSSANIQACAFLRQFGRSLMYNKKSKGPILYPWGIPHITPFCSDLAVRIVHICCLLLKYDLKTSKSFLLIPYCSSSKKRTL
jgi:hypothetical protein